MQRDGLAGWSCSRRTGSSSCRSTGRSSSSWGWRSRFQSRQRSELPLARPLAWLAGFGIVHGLMNWGYLFVPIQAGLLPAAGDRGAADPSAADEADRVRPPLPVRGRAAHRRARWRARTCPGSPASPGCGWCPRWRSACGRWGRLPSRRPWPPGSSPDPEPWLPSVEIGAGAGRRRLTARRRRRARPRPAGAAGRARRGGRPSANRPLPRAGRRKRGLDGDDRRRAGLRRLRAAGRAGADGRAVPAGIGPQ